MSRRKNHLQGELSPYLLRAASDPVEWHPWGEQASTLARERQKPIFLSIGYSASHACHRLQTECFRDEHLARFLSEHFVCVLVDREEHPDVDGCYLRAMSLLTGGAGWPANLFLLPSGEPFFAATGLPARRQDDRPGFQELLQKIVELWAQARPDLERQAGEVSRALREATPLATGQGLPAEARRIARHKLDQVFDPTHGGFGRGAKFPNALPLWFLLGEAGRGIEADPSGHRGPAELALLTLDRMSEGGVYDQVAGGFFRSSSDERWLSPHFEKMATDQALLAGVYLEAFRLTGRSNYRRIARETLDFLLRELRGPDGGFFSSLDADSRASVEPVRAGRSAGRSARAATLAAPPAQEEGAFYLLSPDQVRAKVGEPSATHFCTFFGIRPDGPWRGRSVPHVQRALSAVAHDFGLSESEFAESLTRARLALASDRATRPRPDVDDKIVTATNGLIITVLTRAAVLLDEAEYLGAALRAADFILERQLTADGRLCRYHRGESSSIGGRLEDYLCLAEGLLALYEVLGRAELLEHSLALTRQALELFTDPSTPALRSTTEDLFVAFHPGHDGGQPAGNAVAIRLLGRLAVHTGDHTLRARAESISTAFASAVHQRPESHTELLDAAAALYEDPLSVVIGGSDEAARELLLTAHRTAHPQVIHARVVPGQNEAAESVLTRTRSVPGPEPWASLASDARSLAMCDSEDQLRARLPELESELRRSARQELGRSKLGGKATPEATRGYLDRCDIREAARGRLGQVFISRLGLGTRRVGLDAEDHRSAVRCALLGGLNLVDTSPAFALGDSERLVGQVLAEVCQAGIERECFVLATKVGLAQGGTAQLVEKNAAWAAQAVPTSPGAKLKDGAFCLAEDFLSWQLERSRERLGVEHLDVALIQSPEYLLLAGKTWDETRMLLGRAFVHLEKECAQGHLGGFGVYTATATRPAQDRAFVPLLDLVDLARETLGPQNHFLVCELPVNLVECEALLPGDQERKSSAGDSPTGGSSGASLGPEQPSLASELQARGVSVWAARPLSAVSDDALTRLVDPPRASRAPGLEGQNATTAVDSDSDPASLRRARYKVASLEAEFETTFAARLRLSGFAQDGPLLPMSGKIGKSLEQMQSLEQFNLAESTLITPRLRGLLQQLDRVFTGDAGLEWARFRQAYAQAVGDFLAVVRALAINRNRSLLSRLRQQIQTNPAFAASPTARTTPAHFLQLSLGLLLEHPALTTTLVGLRHEDQVKQALALLR